MVPGFIVGLDMLHSLISVSIVGGAGLAGKTVEFGIIPHSDYDPKCAGDCILVCHACGV